MQNHHRAASLALLSTATLALSAIVGCSYSPIDADRAVTSPRLGRVLTPPAGDARTASGVAVVYSSREDINLKLAWEQGHAWDLHKARRIYHQLIADGAIKPDDVFVPEPIDDELLRSVHQQSYLDSLDRRAVLADIFGASFPRWQSQADHRDRVVAALKTSAGGTVQAAELAAAHGLAIHLGGGFTHAFPDRGGHSSAINDVAVAIRACRQNKVAQRVLVVSLGAMQANGLAACLAGDSDAYLLNLYEQNNYPPAKQPFPGAVPMPNGIGNSEYQALLEAKLPRLLDDFKPQLVIYLAGVDVVAGDPDGRSELTLAGVVARDLYVARQVRDRKIPLCIVLDGGWASDSWTVHYRSIRALLGRYGGVPFKVN